MEKLTKSLPLFKERNCSVSIVLDSRTRRKNAYEFHYLFVSRLTASSSTLQLEVLLLRKSSRTSAMRRNVKARTTNFRKSGKIPLPLSTKKS